MKKSTIWTIVVIVVIILIGIIGFSAGWFGNSSTSNQPSTMTSSTGNTAVNATSDIVNYFCDSGTITANYATGTVALKLSDGRTFTLPQTISGSGISYEEGSGTSQDVEFQSEGSNAFLTENGSTTYNNCVAGQEMSMASGSEMYTDANDTFSLTYPSQFTLTGGGVGFTQDWRAEATSSGVLLVKITIPQSFEPKTNFGDATFTIGTSADPGAVAGCLTDTAGEKTTSANVIINGVSFTRLNFTDVGAGQIYDTTSYRTVRNNQCYAVEYTIHSGNINNYDPSQGISAFDETKVQAVLDGIAQSVKFM
jgi:membrane-bound inhibitor of C-type lysozyme